MAKKVCLISDHHICINPRLWKEAFFYEELGFEVVILTKWHSDDLRKRDIELLKGHNISYGFFLNLIPGEINPVMRFYYRLRKRVASELQHYLKAGGAWAINHAPDLLYKAAMKENATLYSAHLESGFYAGRKLVKAGRKVSFDFEDWYSQDYITSTRPVKLLQELEKFALLNGLFCTAASEAMAIALQQTYSSSKKITVIYNSFLADSQEAEHTDHYPDHKTARFIWTSRTVGGDRGLEDFAVALQDVKYPVELQVVGTCDNGYREDLQKKWPVKVGHRLLFVNFLSHSELMKLIPTFDVGLALEKSEPASRNKTVTNKTLQYLQSGIKVLATATDGQSEVARHFPDSVFLLSTHDFSTWAIQIEKAILQGSSSRKSEQHLIYEQSFSWGVQQQKLKQLISEHL